MQHKAVSVESPPQVASLPPTWSIGYRRARLLTFSAALRSPQTCFRLPHCLGNRHTCCLASQPPAFGHPLSGGPSCLRQRQPAAFPALLPCGMPTTDVSPLTRTCHRSGFRTPVGCADIPFQGNFRPHGRWRRSSYSPERGRASMAQEYGGDE